MSLIFFFFWSTKLPTLRAPSLSLNFFYNVIFSAGEFIDEKVVVVELSLCTAAGDTGAENTEAGY